MLRSVLLCALLAVVSADFVNIGYRDCKSTFKITSVSASDCVLKENAGKKLCEFKEGTTPVIRISFIPSSDVADLKTSVKAKIGETMLDFPMSDANACKFGLACPLVAGQEYTYEQGIEIINNYPKNEKVQVNWVLDNADSAGKDVCIIFLANIVA